MNLYLIRDKKEATTLAIVAAKSRDDAVAVLEQRNCAFFVTFYDAHIEPLRVGLAKGTRRHIVYLQRNG